MVGWQTTTELEGPSTLYVATARPLLTFGFNRPIMVTNSNIGSGYTLGDPGPLFDVGEGIDVGMNLAWDRSGGPNNGRVHLVYTDTGTPGSERTRIDSRYSDDQGQTWSSEEFISDNVGNSRFMPQLGLDQTTGYIAAAWYDARDSANNTTVDIYYSVSTDGGRTWTANQKLTDGSSDSHSSMNEINFGDYNKMDAYGGNFYPIWADNSSFLDPFPTNLPLFDMATTRVSFAAPGMPSGQTSSNGSFLSAAQGILLGEIIQDGQGSGAINRFSSNAYFQRLNSPVRPNMETFSMLLRNMDQKSSLGLFPPNENFGPMSLRANVGGHDFRRKDWIEYGLVVALPAKDSFFLSEFER